MYILLEIIFDIIFEGSINGVKSKKVPLWIRILCGIIFGLIFLFVVGIMALVSVLMWNQYYNIPSVLFILIDSVFVISAVKKLKRSL